jgi:cell volume regulation protein A
LAVVIRPLLIGLCLIPARLTRNERAFVLFAGLKGAVPILLGSFVLSEAVPHAQRLYSIVVVAVVFSVVVQGSLTPAATRLLHLPVQTVDLEPWALGVRLQDEPDGVFRFSVVEHSGSDGRTIDELGDVLGGAWVSMVVRDGQLLPLGGDASLRAGDDVLVLASPDRRAQLAAQFEVPVSGD